jgi:hypothetical protein
LALVAQVERLDLMVHLGLIPYSQQLLQLVVVLALVKAVTAQQVVWVALAVQAVVHLTILELHQIKQVEAELLDKATKVEMAIIPEVAQVAAALVLLEPILLQMLSPLIMSVTMEVQAQHHQLVAHQ